MICHTCDAGLGIVTVYKNGHFVTETCGECQGAGYHCSSCGGNPAHCGCDDADKHPNKEQMK